MALAAWRRRGPVWAAAALRAPGARLLSTGPYGLNPTTGRSPAKEQALPETAGSTGDAASNDGARRLATAASAMQPVAEPVTQVNSRSSRPQLVYRNVDGERVDDGRYQWFTKDISEFIPATRQFTDPVRTFAYGTDASFYRLNPKLVVKIHNEDEVRRILPLAARHGTPVTFRAAGTSLSGQAVTDSILLKLSHTGKNFRRYEISDEGRTITLEPGIIGGEANRLLAAYKTKNGLKQQYKIGPDPSSIDASMIGGIVSNNSSGMCCGVAQNSYHTVRHLRIVFVDGSVLDTSDPASVAEWSAAHPQILRQVTDLATRVQANAPLASLIRKKFSIKCTTGYSINALVDFPADQPIEIIKRLMIGSEGTLGFVSRAVYNTVPEYPDKASAFIMFPSIETACEAANVLRCTTSVDAVEMFDRECLKGCEKSEEMVRLVKGLAGCGEEAASLLVECRGQDAAALEMRINEVVCALRKSKIPILEGGIEAYPFSKDEKACKLFWDMRKGLIPIVGGAREPGTSMLIEDVAVDVTKLAALTKDLVAMFKRFGYNDASAFGHALEGNLHLVFSQGFRTDAEVQRYSDMMEELCVIVAEKYGGSLKAEHSTGRNMAPFVEMEWGSTATAIMWELKEIFDKEYVLNPGVILNHDPDVHKKALKPSPVAHKLVDACIECGFCESNCPSRDTSLTPRQRITVFRELKRLEGIAAPSAEESSRLKEMSEIYQYQGEATCAADGMCQEKCPVKINTGELIKTIRKNELSGEERYQQYAASIAGNFARLTGAVPAFLNLVSGMHSVFGPGLLTWSSELLNRVSGRLVPTWNPYMPKGAPPLKAPLPPVANPAVASSGVERRVVYVPSCVTRMMGPAKGDEASGSVTDKLLSLCSKAGYTVVYPEGVSNLCCGMMFNSRGFADAASTKSDELEAALLRASDGGKYPIVMDTSPCLKQMKESFASSALKMGALYDPVAFIDKFLVDKLDFSRVKESVAVHVPCSSKKLGLEPAFMKLAGMCATKVHSSGVPCCGMAGDRGMRYPELTGGALQHLALPAGCSDGYSTSRTCEMSLSNHSGVHFRGLVHLVDEATRPKAAVAK